MCCRIDQGPGRAFDKGVVALAGEEERGLLRIGGPIYLGIYSKINIMYLGKEQENLEGGVQGTFQITSPVSIASASRHSGAIQALFIGSVARAIALS
jgi:hypothetical protein